MYYSFKIVRMKQRAERFVGEIFRTLVDDPRQLPPDYQRHIDDRGVKRVVADYIAAMTDRSALLEYRRLFDPLMQP